MKSLGIKSVTTIRSGKQQPDLVAVEEPLEIRIGFGAETNRQQARIAVTMRTPGHDEELVIGFLFGEGIISGVEDIIQVRSCAEVGKPDTGNVLRVELRSDLEVDLNLQQRNFYTTSSCGICGKASVDAIQTRVSRTLKDVGVRTTLEQLKLFPEVLRNAQTNFTHTGGIHASGLFDVNGKLIAVREDVGRHNAMDKVVGGALMRRNPFADSIVLLSGRISFELVQKAVMAGVPFLAAVGAPSSLAIDLAQEFGMTLVGFLNENNANIYSGEWRVNA